jgi:hypothetical protein
MKNSDQKNVSKSTTDHKVKAGLKSAETSSNVKTGNASEEQKLKRNDASWKK